MVTTNFRLLTVLSLLLIIAGDVELNPGPIGDGKRASIIVYVLKLQDCDWEKVFLHDFASDSSVSVTG